MSTGVDYQKEQLEAIYFYYKSLKKEVRSEIPLKEAVISWFAEGYAEQFREDYLKDS